MGWSSFFRALVAALAGWLIACGGTTTDDWSRAADLTTLATVARVDNPDALTITADSLAVAGGQEVELFFEVASPAVLRIDRLAGRGATSGPVLQVAAQRDGGPLDELARLPPTDTPVELALPDSPDDGAPTPLRLVLRTPTGPGAVLFSPEIRVPPEVSGTVPEGAFPEVSGTLPALPEARPDRPNLLIYLVDTLRADRLGLYGYERPTSPRLDELAGRPGSVVFDDMVAVSSWTRPTVATLLTGLAPDVHGVHGRRDRLADEVDTLAEILDDAGYRTAARVANSNVIGRFGFAQGFDDFRWLRTQSPNHRSPGLGRLALGWLDELDPDDDAPFFLYVHTVDPHSPYQPPKGERARFAPDVPPGPVGTRPWLRDLEDDPARPTEEEIAWLSDLYDAEVAANDRSFGDLLDGLAARGLDRDTVVVFVSDHGEEFGEHGGLEHGRTLHGEQLHVPFVVHLPGRRVSPRIGAQVDHLDFLPTVLAALGLDAPPGLPGRNLLPWIEGSGGPAAPDDAHRTLSWLDLEDHRSAAVTEGRWKAIQPGFVGFPAPERATASDLLGSRPPLLYDRRDDPGETRNRSAERPVRAGLLDTVLAFRLLHPQAAAVDGGEAELDAETIEELRALGYLR